MKIRIIFLYFFLVIISHPKFCHAQNEKALRVEIEAKSNSNSYTILPFGEKGVLLFYQSTENTDNYNDLWNFTLYSTDFKEVWTKDEVVLKDLAYKYFDSNDTCLYLFFENSKSFSAKGNFQVLKIDIDAETITSYSTNIPVKASVMGFKVINDIVMLSGHILPNAGKVCWQACLMTSCIPQIIGYTATNYSPFLFTYNLKYGNTKLISDPYKGQARVENLSVDEKDSVFVASIKNYAPKNNNYLYIDRFNTNGSKIGSMAILANNDNKMLNTSKLISLSESNKILIGTYDNLTKRSFGNGMSRYTQSSTGIYFTSFVNEEQQFIKYYNFSKFPSFYTYLGENRKIKIKKKAQKLESKGKELSFSTNLLVHNIIKRDSTYIMVAEAYYPEYHTEYYTTTEYSTYSTNPGNYQHYYGGPKTVQHSRSVFDGYRYTHALVACFDKEGELLWDNSFEIMNILTFSLHERVNVLIDSSDIILTYSQGGNIASKIIRNNEVIEGKQYTKIETNFDNDKVLTNYNSDMDYWYGNYFISYGYQKIKNTQQDKSKRTVFYFNKIAFE
jgi:hypothetical protein